MELTSLIKSNEVLTGTCLIVAGILAPVAGIHSVLTMAMIPFGIGLILSEVFIRFGRATRERVKIRVRSNDRPNRRP